MHAALPYVQTLPHPEGWPKMGASTAKLGLNGDMRKQNLHPMVIKRYFGDYDEI